MGSLSLGRLSAPAVPGLLLSDEHGLVKEHVDQCISELAEFFFGDWRHTFQKALVKWLEYYRKEEFPKEKVTKKITIEGTFFVHWGEKEGLPVTVPPEFADHIVRLG